jgi:sugar lactone lactonase YvrE
LGNSSKTSFKLKVLGTTAFRVYGTSGAFNTSAANACTGGLAVNGANCLSAPRGLVFDSNDNLYVADSGNHRVLFFQKGNTTATIVYGQNDFNSGGINRGGSTAQNSLRTPQGITFSPTGELYIADADNNRVVVYPKDSNSTANRVIGKTGSFTNNVSGTNIDSFSATGNITFDSQGNFYIADVTNHRVLYYPSGTFTPTKVYGQPNFITGTSGTTQITLSFPISVTVHPTRGDLYLMDQLNKRILFYGTSESTTPSSITFGQTIYTTSNTACNSTSFNAGPTDAAFDSNDALFFTDSGGGHRVLVMPFPYTSVTRVFGQTNLVTCNGTSSATGLNNPQWLEFDSFGNLYVSDTGNNRILVF